MAMDDDADDGRVLAAKMMADAELERLQSYLERGRPLAGHGSDHLHQVFVVAFKQWSIELGPSPQALDDAIAEYGLRKQEPPFEDVKEEMQRVTNHASGIMANQSDDRREAILNEIVERYFINPASKQ